MHFNMIQAATLGNACLSGRHKMNEYLFAPSNQYRPRTDDHIIVASEFVQKTRNLRLAVLTCWLPEILLFF